MSRGKPWTPLQLSQLREHYPHQPASVAANIVGRSVASCYAKAAQIGLMKTPDFLASADSGRVQRGNKHPNMMASQFKPGLIPWNKNKSYQAGGRSLLTRFKPGSKPPTTLLIGSYRVTKHRSGRWCLEQKTSDTRGANNKRWTPVTRIVWQAAHGPIPPGHIVVFKPGKHTTELALITAEKLDCITRKELAARNHINNISPELAKLCQLKGAITRQVNRIQTEYEQAQQGRKQTAS